MSGFCRVGRNLRRWKEQARAFCPRCSLDNKTKDHVIQCKEDEAERLWYLMIDKVKSKIKKNKGISTLEYGVEVLLQAYRKGGEIIHETNLSHIFPEV